MLQVNCRTIYNKTAYFRNLVGAINPDIVIGTESSLREEIGNAKIFRADFTNVSRDMNARGGGAFVCTSIKNNVACSELWVDGEFEMKAVEVKGSDPTYTWEIVGIYRAPNGDGRYNATMTAGNVARCLTDRK